MLSLLRLGETSSKLVLESLNQQRMRMFSTLHYVSYLNLKQKLISRLLACSGLSYIWWSSLPNVAKISGDKLHVPHFTDKYLVGEKMNELGLKVINISPAFYYSNWTNFFRPSQPEDGVLQWTLPMKPDTLLSAFDVAETGLAVGKTLANPEDHVGSSASEALFSVHKICFSNV